MVNNKENIKKEFSTELELSNLKNEIISNVEIHDWDPENPYHYYTADGKKVVITPKDWEKYKDDPIFREIRAAVEAERAACPGPEYEINTNFIRSLRGIYSSSFGDNFQNYKNFGKYLPEGYSFTPEGVIIGPDGTAYVQSGFKQSNRFKYSTDNPLQFTIYKGKPIEKNLTFYPIDTEKKIKPPHPVDRVMDVGEEREKAINDYINNVSISKQVTKHYPSKGYYKDTYYPYIDVSNKAYIIHTISNTKSTGLVRLRDKELEQIPEDKNNPNVLITYPKNRDYTEPVQFIVPFETDNPNYSDSLDLTHNGGFSPTIEWVRDNGNTTKGLTWDKGYPVHREIVVTTPAYDKISIQQVKPSREEAEKNAIIKVG